MGLDGAAVGLDQFACDGQADAQAGAGQVALAHVRLAEHVEHLAQELGVDAMAGVDHIQPHARVFHRQL
ncbi:hypothetical protein D3C86_2158940 [compost metagenome]